MKHDKGQEVKHQCVYSFIWKIKGRNSHSNQMKEQCEEKKIIWFFPLLIPWIKITPLLRIGTKCSKGHVTREVIMFYIPSFFFAK